MRFIHYLYMVPLALFTACNSKEELVSNAIEHPNGEIQLSAGIVEGGSAAVTRAGAEDNHGNHLTLTEHTKLALQVSGTWTGHTPSPVVQTTTATVGSETSTGSKHNNLSCSPVLYWDDYGTADHTNASTGRTEGLTIYGVAIDGYKNGEDFELPSSLTNISNWEALDWTLTADQTSGENIPAKKDLLVSNNVTGENADADDQLDHGRYLFEKRTVGKLLEFKHALSKITVNLTAGEGFPASGFEKTEVKLVNKEGTTTETDSWAYTQGTVNIHTGGVTKTDATNKVITMYGGSSTGGTTAQHVALVIPGSAFASDNAVIAKIKADGNIYYVKAKEIRTAIDGVNHDSGGAYPTEAGKNYVLKIIVNKTDIQVTATVTNWVDVNAVEEEPVINVNADWGASGDPTTNTFSFYRSTSVNNGYSTGLKTGDYYPYESTVSKVGDGWTMSSRLYWPTHDTHYQFRGVWPATVTTAGEGVLTSPRVEDATHDEVYQVIKVKNVPYVAGTFPSDLMIGRPEFEKDGSGHYPTCNNSDHSPTDLYNEGICATEGKINLNFRYMMSQVEVRLTTSGSTASDRVNLSGAVVEIVNVFNTGDVKLGDREVLTTGDKGNYTLDAVANVPDDPATLDVDESVDNSNKRWSAIVPQSLAYTSSQHENNMKFKITITNADSSTDVYYADIQPIPVLEEDAEGPAAPTTHWVSGKHYIYTLHLTKTEVQVTATLTDWKKVEASQNVWF
ncbi:MAG: fimbrillin family protein [Prevotella sp.]|nr:fimbrillin family protein [Prevotella sp.]